MELSIIFGIVTVVVTYLLGILAKKVKYIESKLIPLQNLVVGILVFIIYYAITKDFDLVIAGVGLFAGGTYDLATNIKSLFFSDVTADNSDNSDEEG